MKKSVMELSFSLQTLTKSDFSFRSLLYMAVKDSVSESLKAFAFSFRL